ncbi:hypothetical protein F01_550103 [Burkholderia cenocepacia]|nr:hypothetical protein F01_550103 [Burkholderia cenocepacia]
MRIKMISRDQGADPHRQRHQIDHSCDMCDKQRQTRTPSFLCSHCGLLHLCLAFARLSSRAIRSQSQQMSPTLLTPAEILQGQAHSKRRLKSIQSRQVLYICKSDFADPKS